MERQKALEIIEELLEIEDLTENASLEDVEEWDSMTKLSFMAYVKKFCKKEINVKEIKDFKTVRDLCDYLENS